jgi:hypothetical protein
VAAAWPPAAPPPAQALTANGARKPTKHDADAYPSPLASLCGLGRSLAHRRLSAS